MDGEVRRLIVQSVKTDRHPSVVGVNWLAVVAFAAPRHDVLAPVFFDRLDRILDQRGRVQDVVVKREAVAGITKVEIEELIIILPPSKCSILSSPIKTWARI